jgi:hypothetical protein
MAGMIFTTNALNGPRRKLTWTGTSTRHSRGGGRRSPNSNGCTIKHCLQLFYSVYEYVQKPNVVNCWPVCSCIRPPTVINHLDLGERGGKIYDHDVLPESLHLFSRPIKARLSSRYSMAVLRQFGGM